jgi:signal peptidase I
MKQATMKKLLPILIPVFCTILVLVLFRFVFYLGYVPTASMEPTIHQGSLILGLRQFGELHTGDVVIFRRDGRTLVKRIVASPGETYILNGSPITVPAGQYLLLGDNANDSYDARYWDDPFVPEKDLIAILKR